jgi:ribosome-binding protein aMBF1 (putative translation factor)
MGDRIEAQARWRKRGIGRRVRSARIARGLSQDDLDQKDLGQKNLGQKDLGQTIGFSQQQIQILALLKAVLALPPPLRAELQRFLDTLAMRFEEGEGSLPP